MKLDGPTLLSDLEVKAFASRDEQEVAGYAEVMETIFAHADAIDLTENHIKQLHRDLLNIPQRTTGIVAHTKGCLITSRRSGC